MWESQNATIRCGVLNERALPGETHLLVPPTYTCIRKPQHKIKSRVVSEIPACARAWTREPAKLERRARAKACSGTVDLGSPRGVSPSCLPLQVDGFVPQTHCKVDGFVPQTQNVNLRIAEPPDLGRPHDCS